MEHSPEYRESSASSLCLLPDQAKGFQIGNAVSAAEIQKGFVGIPSLHVCAEKPLDDWRQLVVRGGRNQFARQTLILLRTSTNKDQVALFARYSCAQQSDIANVV